jgi:5'(3')-deoxyribonucleotidase
MANLNLTPKPTAFVDLDGMAVNLIARLIEFYNATHGTQVTFDTAWQHFSPIDAENGGRPVGDALDHFLVRDRVFHDLDPLPGFAEVLPELQDMCDLRIASAPSRNPDSASDKVRWVLERFPTITRKKIILIKEKFLLKDDVRRGDVWLEDWHTNIREIREASPQSFVGAIAYPYNEEVSNLLNMRADSFRDTTAAWKQLVVGVRDYLARRPK